MSLVSGHARRQERRFLRKILSEEDAPIKKYQVGNIAVNAQIEELDDMPLAQMAAAMVGIALTQRKNPSWKAISLQKLIDINYRWFASKHKRSDPEAIRRLRNRNLPTGDDLTRGINQLALMGYLRLNYSKQRLTPTVKLAELLVAGGDQRAFQVPGGIAPHEAFPTLDEEV